MSASDQLPPQMPEITQRPQKPRHPMMEKLSWLIGTWPEDGDFYPYGQHFPNRKGLFRFEWKCVNKCITWEIYSDGPLEYYESLAIFYWDEQEGCFIGSWTDNDALMVCHRVRLHLEGEDTLVFDCGNIHSHIGTAKARFIIKRTSEKTFTCLVDLDFGGGWQTVIVQRAQKLF